MMMLPHLQRLFSYDNWANKEVLVSLQRIEKPPARLIQLLAHIVSAERLWLERIEVRPQTLPVWPSLTLTQCEQEMGTLSGRFRGYLSAIGEEELTRKIKYVNSKGESFLNEVQDILMHVVMHSVYHRGQIASDVRSMGFQPAYTDFIHGVRQRFIE
jgi:uncharacterized damage-inducible protein DinB